uniref:Uncharacterized protein n=1 Tax=Rhizophora mucronata TaxID=61149 RepID=A0A2P2IT12_RHIMU
MHISRHPKLILINILCYS